MQNIWHKIPLKKLISEKFTKETGKYFYSFEITPKENFHLDLANIRGNPFFVNISWYSDQNLKFKSILESPAMKMKKDIESKANVVSTITCYKMEEHHLDEILGQKDEVKNFAVLRGDAVDPSQKYKTANDLIKAIRDKTKNISDKVTIFAGCYPEAKDVDANIKFLKEKVDAGVDVLISQTIFSSDPFCDFVRKCREAGITVPIIPGIHMPYKLEKLEFMLKLTKAFMPANILEDFKSQSNPEDFQKLGLAFTTDLIHEIQEKAPEHIPGFHIYTLNSINMVNKLTQTINFADIS